MRGKIRPRRAVFFLLLALALPSWFVGLLRLPNPKLGKALEPYAQVDTPLLREASGLVQSQTFPNLFWSHNDSGDLPRFFALEATGRTPEKLSGYQGFTLVGAANVDWEDIAASGDKLYLCDVGNNLNRRRDLGVYEVTEPSRWDSHQVPVDRFLPLRYPDQSRFPPHGPWDFDCEAVFVWQAKLYFVTKCRPAFRLGVQAERAALYRLDTEYTDRENVLTRVDQVDGLGGWVTAADTSRDGRYLAILVESPVQSVWLYERPSQGDRFFSQPASVRRQVFHGGGQLESLAFRQTPQGTEEILLLNEARELFQLSLSDFAPALNPIHKSTGNDPAEPNSER